MLNFFYGFCSVRTPISMKFFPRFFLLYFLVFHIYFFSYAYGMMIACIFWSLFFSWNQRLYALYVPRRFFVLGLVYYCSIYAPSYPVFLEQIWGIYFLWRLLKIICPTLTSLYWSMYYDCFLCRCSYNCDCFSYVVFMFTNLMMVI